MSSAANKTSLNQPLQVRSSTKITVNKTLLMHQQTPKNISRQDEPRSERKKETEAVKTTDFIRKNLGDERVIEIAAQGAKGSRKLHTFTCKTTAQLTCYFTPFLNMHVSIRELQNMNM